MHWQCELHKLLFVSPSVRKSRRDWIKNESIIQFYDDLAMSEKGEHQGQIRSKPAPARNKLNAPSKPGNNIRRIHILQIFFNSQVYLTRQTGCSDVMKPASRYENQSLFPWVYQCFPSSFLAPSTSFSVFFLGTSCSFAFIVSMAAWRISEGWEVWARA